ncbi:MAG: methyltransferase domain-containing protein [Thermodesulfobacteriota bacterium]
MQPYNVAFYKRFLNGMILSAKEVVPIMMDLIQPKSVVDVGCGVGAWLSVFLQNGVEDICGIDGNYIDKSMLQIPDNCFISHDLKDPLPLSLNRQYDLVTCLEVAEHLPKEYAESLVDSLTSLGPVICFSAAIPFQGESSSHHVNEQWPEYWARFFNKKGYITIDCIRKKIWKNDNIEFWYAQNILLYVKKEYLGNLPLLEKEYAADTSQLSVVHPKCYLTIANPKASLIRVLCSILPVSIVNKAIDIVRSIYKRRTI